MTTLRSLGVACAALLLAIGNASGRQETTALNGTVVAAGDEVRIGVSLDAVVTSEAGRLGEVLLEWNVTGLSSEEPAEFRLYLSPTAWSSASELASLRLSETPWGTWTIEGADFERAGGLVRFDIAEILKAWRAGDPGNHGLVIVTAALSAPEWAQQAASIRVRKR